MLKSQVARPGRLLVAGGLLMLAMPASVQAQPKVDSLFPPGGSAGAEVECTLAGTFPAWPVQVDAIGQGLTWEFQEAKGKARIRIAAEASPGPRLVRFFDAKGVSQWRLFQVSRHAESIEKEPNESPQTGQDVPLPAIVNGRFEKGGDVDTYRVRLAAGQQLVACLDGARLGGGFDSVLQICDSQGSVLAQNDDERGLDPLLTYTATEDGDYLVRGFCFPKTPNSTIGFAGNASYIYRLTMTTSAFVDFVLPLARSESGETQFSPRGWGLSEANAASHASLEASSVSVVFAPDASGAVSVPTFAGPTLVAPVEMTDAPLTTPISISGVLAQPGEEDVFTVQGKKGGKLRIAVDAFSLGFPLDPLLVIEDASGKVLKETDDQSRSERDPATEFAPAADGVFRVRVRDRFGFGGPRFAYRLSIVPVVPDFVLTTTTAALAVEAGKEAEWTIDLARMGGYAENVQLEVEGLPEGVTVDAPALDGKAKNGKVKLVAGKEAKAFSGPIRILAKGPGDAMREATFKAVDIPVTRLWLTVTRP